MKINKLQKRYQFLKKSKWTHEWAPCTKLRSKGLFMNKSTGVPFSNTRKPEANKTITQNSTSEQKSSISIKFHLSFLSIFDHFHHFRFHRLFVHRLKLSEASFSFSWTLQLRKPENLQVFNEIPEIRASKLAKPPTRYTSQNPKTRKI